MCLPAAVPTPGFRAGNDPEVVITRSVRLRSIALMACYSAKLTCERSKVLMERYSALRRHGAARSD
jgi:hypothetical protein